MWYVNTCFQLRTHKNTSSQPGSVISNVNHNLKNLHKQNKKHIPESFHVPDFQHPKHVNRSPEHNLFSPLFTASSKQMLLCLSCFWRRTKTRNIIGHHLLYLKLYVLVYTLWIKQNEGGHSHQFSETLDTHTVLTKANSGIIWDL